LENGCAAAYGERAGIRTLDLLIKSQLLYRLSYALGPFKVRRNIGRDQEAVNLKAAGAAALPAANVPESRNKKLAPRFFCRTKESAMRKLFLAWIMSKLWRRYSRSRRR
jgi:hypothetical protein